MKKVFLLLCIFTAISLGSAWAQDRAPGPNSLEYMEDEGDSLWEQDGFIDPTSEDALEQSGEYIGDEEVRALEEAARRRGGPGIDLAAALEKDKQLLPDNMKYGLATGLVIGGWFALLQGQNARDNTRYIGLGVVGGIMLGLAIGTKSVYQPLLRQQRGELYLHPSKDPLLLQPLHPQKPAFSLMQWDMKF